MFSVLFVVGANCVRPLAFTERPYGISLSIDKTCFMEGARSGGFWLMNGRDGDVKSNAPQKINKFRSPPFLVAQQRGVNGIFHIFLIILSADLRHALIVKKI